MADNTFATTLWYNTQMLASIVESFYKMVSDPLDLTVVEWHVLQTLYRQDGQRPTDLAPAVGRDVTAFTVVLNSLERKGWIVRQGDTLDRRVVRVHLTDHAQQNRAQFDQSVTILETYLRAHLSESDLHDLLRLREQLVQS
jgi:MarR family transcriptional regulator, organic hydroperoxide resistance regulator